jgi:two-component system cell cycle response regulator DivK
MSRDRAMADPLILIVEDNDKNLKLVRDLLQRDGCQTLEAGTAEAAITLAEQCAPDVILMDIQLPDTDGVTALGRLRASAATSSIPVVALTAFAMASDRERLLAAGFDGYLAKPIDIHDFSERVREFCEPT